MPRTELRAVIEWDVGGQDREPQIVDARAGELPEALLNRATHAAYSRRGIMPKGVPATFKIVVQMRTVTPWRAIAGDVDGVRP